MTKLIEELAPKKLALDWDNVGLMVGSGAQTVKKVMICLDAPMWVVDEAIAKGVDLIITHHPLIFGSLKKVNTDSVLGRKIIKLIQNHISLYSAHTNYDLAVGGLNDLATQTLGFDRFEIIDVMTDDGLGLGRLVTLDSPMTAGEMVARVKEKLELPFVRFAGDPEKKIKRFAVVNGSGNHFSSTAKFAGADLLITGDLSYHEILDAVEMEMCIIDAGHYGTEKMMMKSVAAYLNRRCAELDYTVELILSETNTDPIAGI